jgi:hypothetical protein|tara:strand:- start:172 stop:450 length:279 start_codon:yes stop_codon:yes gene_type:complete
MKKSEFMKTEGGRLFGQLEAAARRVITVPNHLLPEDFQDNRTDGVTLAALEKKCDARDLETNHEYEKREKAKRVEMYAKQIAAGREIMYLPR